MKEVGSILASHQRAPNNKPLRNRAGKNHLVNELGSSKKKSKNKSRGTGKKFELSPDSSDLSDGRKKMHPSDRKDSRNIQQLVGYTSNKTG